jgi:NADH-quinone oxidoreductase subunit I
MATKPLGYWQAIGHTSRTLLTGLRVTWQHLVRPQRQKPLGVAHADYFTQPGSLVTIRYPKEQIPVPEVGRYQLEMVTEDCIGCELCARICPVDCIDIQRVKAVEQIGTTSDGSKKLFYLPTFDIDHAKCCYCGLCTVVCPTECLTMTNTYDFSVTNVRDLNLAFGNLSPEEAAEKERELAEFEAMKARLKAEAAAKAAAEKAAQASNAATATPPPNPTSATSSTSATPPTPDTPPTP